ncbi:hypothetical protein [Dietzia sp. MNB45]|uniref:hypothetical protein n=1 Tax=Dietzia sp. MNB45 TaxID=3238800 RepID=UPI003F7DF3C5
MAFISKRVSDISGKELEDGEVLNIVVRNHPDLDEAKQIDTSEEEIKSLKTVDGLVELEIRPANGEPRTEFVTKAELAKLVPLDVLQHADAIRGRRKGVRLNGS